MNNILMDNALEARGFAIKYCNELYNGNATLSNKKMFVSSLHNTVELFMKQQMINNNDHSVIE